MNPLHLLWIVPLSMIAGCFVAGLCAAARETSEVERLQTELVDTDRQMCEYATIWQMERADAIRWRTEAERLRGEVERLEVESMADVPSGD